MGVRRSQTIDIPRVSLPLGARTLFRGKACGVLPIRSVLKVARLIEHLLAHGMRRGRRPKVECKVPRMYVKAGSIGERRRSPCAVSVRGSEIVHRLSSGRWTFGAAFDCVLYDGRGSLYRVCTTDRADCAGRGGVSRRSASRCRSRNPGICRSNVRSASETAPGSIMAAVTGNHARPRTLRPVVRKRAPHAGPEARTQHLCEIMRAGVSGPLKRRYFFGTQRVWQVKFRVVKSTRKYA
jgi:hypothetical protein